ncbi:DNA-binding HTH domain, TetR-type [Candidatus Nanopelagicaceae bacterium]
MAAKKQAVQAPGGRQAAYSARNRARLIKDAQIVLAEIGPSATIEQIAAHAEVSPTTIYKYFENKDQLFLEALGEAWIGFLMWANQLRAPGDRLERTLDSGRKVFWAKKTHPLFAEMLHNCLTEMPDFLAQSDKGEGKKVFKEIAASGEIKTDDFEKRYVLWTNIYTGILKSVFVTNELSPSEADVAMGIGLSVWGISESKAKKLISRPLEFAPVE